MVALVPGLNEHLMARTDNSHAPSVMGNNASQTTKNFMLPAHRTLNFTVHSAPHVTWDFTVRRWCSWYNLFACISHPNSGLTLLCDLGLTPKQIILWSS